MNTQAQQAPTRLQTETACRRMSAAAILAKTSPAPAAPGEARAPAPGAENDASAFADMMVDDVPADEAPVSNEAPASKPVSTAPSEAKSGTGLLSSSAFVAVQQSGADEASAAATAANVEADAAAAPPAKADVTDAVPAEDAATESDGDDASLTAKDETLATPAPLPPAPVVPAPAPPVTTTPSSSAEALARAMAEAAGSESADLPQDAAPADTDAPPADAPAEPVTAAPVSTFEQAVANASAATSKSQLTANAATAGQNTSSSSATPSSAPGAQTSGQGADASPPVSTPPTVPASTPSPAVLAEAAPLPSVAAPASAQPQIAAAAPAPAVAPTNVSHISQASLDTTVQIAAQITRELKGRSTRFEMGLTPEGLGRVDVSLDIDSGGQLTARLAFDNPLAATELRGKVDELRRELTDAGFTIAHDGLDFSERQPSSSNGGFDRQQGRAFASASRITDDADQSQPAPAAWMSLSLTRSGVDMKV